MEFKPIPALRTLSPAGVKVNHDFDFSLLLLLPTVMHSCQMVALQVAIIDAEVKSGILLLRPENLHVLGGQAISLIDLKK